MVVINKDEHSKLQATLLIQNANEPALAHISEMATKHEHVVVSANDFNKYLNTFEHPELSS